MHTCVCVHVCVCMRVCVHACVCVRVHVHVPVCVWLRVCGWVCTMKWGYYGHGMVHDIIHVHNIACMHAYMSSLMLAF